MSGRAGALRSWHSWLWSGIVSVSLLAPAALAQQDTGSAGAPDAAPADPVPVETRADETRPTQLALLTLNQAELFEKSAWGAAAIRRAEAAAAALNSENRAIEASLEEEERGLTNKRAQMSAADFSEQARGFDSRVEGIRQTQDAKSRAISRNLDEDRKAFFDAAIPLMGELLDEFGAVAIIADDVLILSRSSADVTQRAIELMDQRLPAPQEPPPAAETPPSAPRAAPDAAPEAVPAP